MALLVAVAALASLQAFPVFLFAFYICLKKHLTDSQVLSKDDHCWKGCEEEGHYVSASLQASYAEYAKHL